MSRYYLGFDPGYGECDHSAWCIMAHRAGRWIMVASGLGEYVPDSIPFITELPSHGQIHPR